MHKATRLRPLHLFSLLTLSLLAACSGPIELTLHNATNNTLVASLRVDRVGSRGESLAQATLKPNARTTLGPIKAPPLEFVELIITRSGDFGDVPTTLRIPRGASAWTLTKDAEAWAGFSIIQGVESAAPNDADE